tara:strand:+ start:197 stop:424 length:228 start_codon:yes stop_codon:yes gene_type:complete
VTSKTSLGLSKAEPHNIMIQKSAPHAAGGDAGHVVLEEKKATEYQEKPAAETGGPKGPEPTRYGDWEQNGRCTDF